MTKLIFLMAILALLCSTFVSGFSLQNNKRATTMYNRAPEMKFDAVKPAAVAAVASSVFLLGGLPIVTTDASQPRNLVAELMVPSAQADFRAAQKRTYFRYIPKFTEGLNYYKDLKTAIEKEDYKNAEAMFEVYVSRYNPNDKSLVDATDFYANKYFYKPMVVMSGTFAERGTSEKQRQLSEQLDNFKIAMKSMEGCFKDMKGEGFFAADIKKPTGGAKKKQALQAWADGRKALKEYVDIFNAGLMREVNTIENVL